ncbi:cytochrome c family protein, partial [Azospirillum brasilense]|nr:cytochrome c family protein [Azospirillum brasilense]
MSMEWNKIFGAVLLAGLIAMLAGFAAEVLVHPKTPEKPAYVVAMPEGAAPAPSGGAAPPGPAALTPRTGKAGPAAARSEATADAARHHRDTGGPSQGGPHPKSRRVRPHR